MDNKKYLFEEDSVWHALAVMALPAMVHFTQAIGRGKESFYLAVIRQLVFNIPLLFLLSSLFGMTGVVWTQAVADLFTVIVSYIIYARIRKQEGWPAGI